VPLAIPKEYERGFALIKSLSDSDIERVLEVLSGAIAAADAERISALLIPALPALQGDDIGKLAATLYSLYQFRGHSDISLDRFVKDISDATATVENGDARTSSEEERKVLSEKLKSLLTVRPLSLISKAHQLHGEAGNLFSGAKVISDIRPVWEGDPTEHPEGTVIIQTLKLSYYDIEGPKELYLNLSDDDIETLISALERARDKAVTLTALAKEGWLRVID
jgi:hypothetical protein